MSKKLLEKLHSMWKKSLITLEEYSNTDRVFRDGTKKYKAFLGLNLAKNVKNIKRSLFKYIRRKRNTGKI